MKKLFEIKRYIFYCWIGLPYLLLWVWHDMSTFNATFLQALLNNFWRTLYIIVVNFVFFEYALAFIVKKRRWLVYNIFFGLVLALRANESKVFATLSWSDAKHSALVVAITAAAIALFEPLGFLTTNVLLIFALLAIVERRALLPAAIYSLGVVVTTYVLFVYVLKTPLETGPFGF